MNILTFDIEEWFLEKEHNGGREFRYNQFSEMFAKVLDTLDEHCIKATFFCVGKLATDFPDVIKTISNRGHEVGCHSNEHTWLDKMNEEELRKDTIEAVKMLEDVSGQKIASYRAPAFSITSQNKWAVNILADCGIENDSSIFPTSREFGGYKDFPQDTPCFICHERAQLKEYPISMTSIIGKTMPYSGGGYFRLLPYWLISKTVKKKEYNICYFHLNDLIKQKLAFKSKVEYEDFYKESGTLKNRLIRYVKSNVGTGDAFEKLTRLLSEYQYVNIQEADNLIDWSNVETVNL